MQSLINLKFSRNYTSLKSAALMLWVPALYLLFFIGFNLLFSQGAFADSGYAAVPSDSSLNPASGNDPLAMFQFMISVGSEIWYVIKTVLLISGLVGIIFIVIGLLKIRASALDSQSGGSHLKHGIILVILGGLLFGAPTLMEVGGYSLFGTAPSSIANNGSVNCQMVNGEYSEGCGNPCPAGSSQSSNGVEVCKCPAGQEMQGAGCVTCRNGSGNSSVGGTCVTCPTGFGTDDAGQCQLCTGDTGANAEGVCAQCTPAQVSVKGLCQACPSGELVSNGACVKNCPDGQTIPTLAWNEPALMGTCQPCPTQDGYVGNPSASGCLCASGYYENPNVDNCTKCPDGSTGTSADLKGCICPGGANFSDGECVCPSEASFANGACVCQSGQFFSNGVCNYCSSYNSSWGQYAACPCTYNPDSYGVSSYCPCKAGMYISDYPNCTCSDGEFISEGSCSATCPSQQGPVKGACVLFPYHLTATTLTTAAGFSVVSGGGNWVCYNHSITMCLTAAHCIVSADGKSSYLLTQSDLDSEKRGIILDCSIS